MERARRDSRIAAAILPMNAKWRDTVRRHAVGRCQLMAPIGPTSIRLPAASFIIGALIGFFRSAVSGDHRRNSIGSSPNCSAPSAIQTSKRTDQCLPFSPATDQGRSRSAPLAGAGGAAARQLHESDRRDHRQRRPRHHADRTRRRRQPDRMGDRRLCAGLRARPAAVRPARRHRRPHAACSSSASPPSPPPRRSAALRPRSSG